MERMGNLREALARRLFENDSPAPWTDADELLKADYYEIADVALGALGLNDGSHVIVKREFLEWAGSFKGHAFAPLRAIGEEAVDILASTATEEGE